MPGGQPEPGFHFQRAAGQSALFRSTLRQLAAATASALLGLLGSTDDQDQLVTVGAAALAAANERAASVADLYLAVMLNSSPIGLGARDIDAGRLENALRIAIDPNQGIAPDLQVDRLARAEPLRAGQHALTDGMTRLDVPGWTRVTGGDACVVCAGFADGEVRPPSVDMYVHPGCSCVAQPVTR